MTSANLHAVQLDGGENFGADASLLALILVGSLHFKEAAVPCLKPWLMGGWSRHGQRRTTASAVLVRSTTPGHRLVGNHRQPRRRDRLVPDRQHQREFNGAACRTGFGFRERVAGIPIGEALLPYNSAFDIYGCPCSSAIGRLSKNWLLAKLTAFYVETLLLLFWYTILQGLPDLKQAWHLGSIAYLSNRVRKWFLDGSGLTANDPYCRRLRDRAK